MGIQFVQKNRFRSTLLTASQLFSLPPPTKMFQFSGFPIHKVDHYPKDNKNLIRQSQVQRKHAPRPGLSQLATTFISQSQA